MKLFHVFAQFSVSKESFWAQQALFEQILTAEQKKSFRKAEIEVTASSAYIYRCEVFFYID